MMIREGIRLVTACLTISIGLGIGSAALGQGAPAPAVKVETDVVYGRVGERALTLDIATPGEGKGPFPAIICLHSGYWQFGSKKDLTQTIRVLALHGYVAVAPNFRLAPQDRFPAALEDCKCVVRWLREHAADYGLNPKAIGVLGHSSGGSLACLLGVTTSADGFDGKGDLSQSAARQSSQVQAVVSFFGLTDLTTGDWDARLGPLLKDYLGGTLSEKPEAYRLASPITHVRPVNQGPVFLLLHGTEDKIAPHTQAQRFVQALKAAGSTGILVAMEGEGHGWSGQKLQRSLVQMVEFFDQNLKAVP